MNKSVNEPQDAVRLSAGVQEGDGVQFTDQKFKKSGSGRTRSIAPFQEGNGVQFTDQTQRVNKFISLLPPALQKDETVTCLAALLDGEIEKIDGLADELLIYARLDDQPETIIDELARSFHMLPNEGYKFADTLEKKRELVKSALRLHRHKGTLYAVKEVLNILGIKGKVLEWFEYGGRPYYFKIDVKIEDGISEKDIAVLEALLNEFKNVRSHLEGIAFKIMNEGAARYAFAGLIGEFVTTLPYIPETISMNRNAFYGASAAIDERIIINPGGDHAR